MNKIKEIAHDPYSWDYIETMEFIKSMVNKKTTMFCIAVTPTFSYINYLNKLNIEEILAMPFEKGYRILNFLLKETFTEDNQIKNSTKENQDSFIKISIDEVNWFFLLHYQNIDKSNYIAFFTQAEEDILKYLKEKNKQEKDNMELELDMSLEKEKEQEMEMEMEMEMEITKENPEKEISKTIERSSPTLGTTKKENISLPSLSKQLPPKEKSLPTLSKPTSKKEIKMTKDGPKI